MMGIISAKSHFPWHFQGLLVAAAFLATQADDA